MMDELRRLVVVDNHDAVQVGDLERTLESLSVVEPKFTADILEAVVREGKDELTLRRGEEGSQRTFINTTIVGGQSMVTTAGGRGVHRHMPSQLQRRRR